MVPFNCRKRLRKTRDLSLKRGVTVVIRNGHILNGRLVPIIALRLAKHMQCFVSPTAPNNM